MNMVPCECDHVLSCMWPYSVLKMHAPLSLSHTHTHSSPPTHGPVQEIQDTRKLSLDAEICLSHGTGGFARSLLYQPPEAPPIPEISPPVIRRSAATWRVTRKEDGGKSQGRIVFKRLRSREPPSDLQPFPFFSVLHPIAHPAEQGKMLDH